MKLLTEAELTELERQSIYAPLLGGDAQRLITDHRSLREAIRKQPHSYYLAVACGPRHFCAFASASERRQLSLCTVDNCTWVACQETK